MLLRVVTPASSTLNIDLWKNWVKGVDFIAELAVFYAGPLMFSYKYGFWEPVWYLWEPVWALQVGQRFLRGCLRSLNGCLRPRRAYMGHQSFSGVSDKVQNSVGKNLKKSICHFWNEPPSFNKNDKHLKMKTLLHATSGGKKKKLCDLEVPPLKIAKAEKRNRWPLGAFRRLVPHN